jgi:hypothetical protein
MPKFMTRRLSDAAGRQGVARGKGVGPMRVYAEGDVYVSSTVSSSTISHTSDRTTFADDLMPAALAAGPILVVLLLLSLTGQTVLLRSIVQEGNPLGLVALMTPLFLPTIAAFVVYAARARGWLDLDVKDTNWLAVGAATGFALFVPLVYVGLQLGAFFVGLLWFTVLRRKLIRHRQSLAIVAVVAIAVLLAMEGVAEHAWPRYSVSRLTVGRMLDGLTRMNITHGDERSVLVISVNDAYAIVASQGYPPVVESMPAEELKKGEICQLESRYDQLSIVRIVGTLLSKKKGTPNKVAICRK